MAKRLDKLVGKDLVFSDEDCNEIPGTLMFFKNYDSNFCGENNYFFVPYDQTNPFRISSHGPNRVSVSQDHGTLYGHSENLERVAKGPEMNALVMIKDCLRTQGKLGTSPVCLSQYKRKEIPSLPRRVTKAEVQKNFKRLLKAAEELEDIK